MSIHIFYDGIENRIRNWKKIRDLMGKVIADEKRSPGDLNFIITNDTVLRNLNKKFLRHNFNTDVISFRYNEGNVIDGEIYVSIDTVKRNALNYKVSYKKEILRVLVHGVLHLCGYEDYDEAGKKKMRVKEDYWLEKYSSY